MHIRKATEQDENIVMSFNNSVLSYHQQIDSFYQPISNHVETTADPEMIVFLAVNDNQPPVAYIQGTFYQKPLDRSVPYAVIQSIWVNEDARGQGISHRLLEQFEMAVKEKGAKQIDLQVDIRNSLGKALWDSAGYTTYQEKRRKRI